MRLGRAWDRCDFKEVLGLVLIFEFRHRLHLRLRVGRRYRLSGRVPGALADFVQLDLTEGFTCQLLEEGGATWVGILPVIDALGRGMVVDPLRLRLRFWRVGNDRIHLPRRPLAQLQEEG